MYQTSRAEERMSVPAYVLSTADGLSCEVMSEHSHLLQLLLLRTVAAQPLDTRPRVFAQAEVHCWHLPVCRFIQ